MSQDGRIIDAEVVSASTEVPGVTARQGYLLAAVVFFDLARQAAEVAGNPAAATAAAERAKVAAAELYGQVPS